MLLRIAASQVFNGFPALFADGRKQSAPLLVALLRLLLQRRIFSGRELQ